MMDTLISLLERLTGEPPPIPDGDVSGACSLLSDGKGLGWSQFNEMLLLLGYDRISSEFFQYLADGTVRYEPGSAILSMKSLEAGVERLQTLALLVFGNFKFAFKNLSSNSELLRDWYDRLIPLDEKNYRHRHDAVVALRRIEPSSTYLLGYIVERELDDLLQKIPDDSKALATKESREAAIRDGAFNHIAYLASDHMDVYVATSMRRRHEYLMVSRLTADIFEHPRLRDLKLRFFDPTQAYCPNRVDKGLTEALMLKRAKCTIYLAQESETLGKDSELASTLAQGKPVIAFVPSGDRRYVDTVLQGFKDMYPDRSEVAILLEQLQVYAPSLAWKDPGVRRWLNEPACAEVDELRDRLYTLVSSFYDKRAETLKCTHPLGIQVYLQTGVANGVLVVRSVDDCAELVRRIVLRSMEFRLETFEEGGQRYTVLREKVSGCVFRVVTGDAMLTNAFWNFYLTPEG